MSDDPRKRIIVDFLNKLEEFVITKLRQCCDGSEWVVNDDSFREEPFVKHNPFSFAKKSWEYRYGVGFEPQENDARGVIIGVWRQYNERLNREGKIPIPGRNPWPALPPAAARGARRRLGPRDIERLNEIRQGEEPDEYWEYWRWLDASYRDLGSEEALRKMRTGEAVEHIGEQLLKIIEVAGPCPGLASTSSNFRNENVASNTPVDASSMKRRRFKNALQEFVITKLRRRPDGSEWFCNDDSFLNDPSARYVSLSFEKRLWESRYGVRLQAEKEDNGDVRIGVYRQYNEETETVSPRLSQKDREKLNREIRQGEEPDESWEYWYPLDDPYRNWEREKALSKLRTGEALEPIGQELMKTIEVAAPIIDEHVRRIS